MSRQSAEITIDHAVPTFEDFWRLYPRKVSKRAAEKSWKREVLSTPPDQIIEGLRRQLPFYAIRDQQFIPHPSTWLNNARWEDEVQIPVKTEKKRSILDAARDRFSYSDNDIGVRGLQH